MYQTCIFDLYGTLVDIRTDEDKPELWQRLALFYAYYGAYYNAEELRHTYGRLTAQLSSGKNTVRRDSHEAFPEIRIEDVFTEMFRIKGVSADEPLVRHAGQFFRALSTERLCLYDGTEEMLKSLLKSGRKVYLLSNAQKIFTEYELNALRLTPCFDGIFISSEHGCKKPDRYFFEKMIRTYDIDRSSAIMIGNDGVCDIRGAIQARLATLYVRTDISPKEVLPPADHVLEHMDMKRIADILLAED